MQIEKIRALADLMKETDLQELLLEEDGVKIGLKRPQTNTIVNTAIPHPAETQTTIAPPVVAAAPEQDFDSMVVTSPMVGVFYAAQSAIDAPFVSVGKTVKAGDVLCIIEAMKLMNEIVAEEDGIITEIFLANGQVVEFDQPLFKMRRVI